MALGTKDGKHTGYTFRGQEIVESRTRGRPVTGLVKKGMERGIFPDEKKIEAVTMYAITGHFGRTSELTSIPEYTLRQWRKQEWFQDLLKEIRVENNEKIDAKFTDIVDKSLDQLTDRVTNGDFHVLRDGTLIRKPITAKDLSLVAAINIDKRQLLRGEPTSRSESVGTIEEKAVSRLENLAKTFEDLAKHGRRTQTLTNQVEDAQIIEDGRGQQPAEVASEGHSEGQISQGEV